jgi:hypothetical protein
MFLSIYIFLSIRLKFLKLKTPFAINLEFLNTLIRREYDLFRNIQCASQL